MSARTVLSSAGCSGQGKTTVTAALARWLVRRGERVRIFKVGADFIDPLLLERACGLPVHVLDLWMVGEADCRAMLSQAAVGADAVLIEGAMGLYDGDPSAADLARVLDLPVLAVLDVGAMAETAGAVATGLRDFGPVRLSGVIANRVAGHGHGHGEMVRKSLREIPLVGTLPSQPAPLHERHLGLVLPAEIENLEERLDALADSLKIREEVWQSIPRLPANFGGPSAAAARKRPLSGRTVAIARDAAFAFLYPANVECLQELGARIRWFSPLADESVPDGAHAVILPGGYPELHGETLSRAKRFHASIRLACDSEVPILAECGGMMALSDALVDRAGQSWPMAGILPGVVRMQERLGGLGLQAWDTGAGVLRGHTFHYSSLQTPLAGIARTKTHPMGIDGEAIYRVGSVTASYFHAYYPSSPAAIVALLETPAEPARSAKFRITR